MLSIGKMDVFPLHPKTPSFYPHFLKLEIDTFSKLNRRFIAFLLRSWGSDTLRATNPIETIDRQNKRSTRGMDTMGKATLESVLAFVTVKIKFVWMNHKIDAKIYTRHLNRKARNAIEKIVEEVGVFNLKFSSNTNFSTVPSRYLQAESQCFLHRGICKLHKP